MKIFKKAEHGSVAFCGDPFGYGSRLIEKKATVGWSWAVAIVTAQRTD
ncbi:MAG: hypothetical protein ACLQO1_09370 [Steroidobacteraceae bacterium]